MKNVKAVVLISLLLGGILFINVKCNSSQQKKTTDNKIESAENSIVKKKKAFKKEWNKKIAQLDKEITKNKKKLKKAGNQNKEKLKGEINNMEAKRDELKDKINTAGKQTEATWQDFTTDVSDTYNKLENKVTDFLK